MTKLAAGLLIIIPSILFAMLEKRIKKLLTSDNKFNNRKNNSL